MVGDEVVLIISENELADEFIWAELYCSLEDDSDACRCKRVVALVVDKIVLENVQADTLSDAVEIVHEMGNIVVWDSGADTSVLDVVR